MTAIQLGYHGVIKGIILRSGEVNYTILVWPKV